MSRLNDKYLHSVEIMPRPELESMQEERLLAAIPYLYEYSPIVKKVWNEAGVTPANIRSLDDFITKVPFTNKDMLRDFRSETNDPFGGQLCVPLEDLTFLATSSGTTGDPTLFAVTGGFDTPYELRDSKKFSADFWYSSLRELWGYGLRKGDYFMCTIPTMRGPSYIGAEQIGATTLMVDHYPWEMPRFVELSLKYRPKVGLMLSTPLILALEQLEIDTGINMQDVFSSYQAIIFGGEPLSERLRKLTDSWGAPLVNMASVGDALVAYECSPGAGLHIWEDQVYAEVLDPETGNPVADGGRGELVVTSITDLVDPLVRFRSEDLVEFTRQPCTCGRTHARYKPLGRLNDLVMVDGQSILPADIWSAVENIPATKAGLFQIIRPAVHLSELKIRVGYAGSPDLTDLKQQVIEAVTMGVGVIPVIELVANEELLKLGPPHKIPRTAKA